MKAVGRLAAGAVGLGVAAFAGTGAFSDDTTRDDAGAIVESGGLGAYVMQIGDCFNDPDAELIESVEGIPCDQPHDNEVYAEFDYPADEWPGEEQLFQDAWYRCLDRFEGYVGRDYETSALDIWLFGPVEEGWAEGDRLITCFVFDYYGEKLTVSARNSGL